MNILIAQDFANSESYEKFAFLKTEIAEYMDVLIEYETAFKSKLCKLIPLIRAGHGEETELDDLIKAHNASPFGKKGQERWVESTKEELRNLEGLLSQLQQIPSCMSKAELNKKINNPGYKHVFVLNFLSTRCLLCPWCNT